MHYWFDIFIEESVNLETPEIRETPDLFLLCNSLS